MWRAIMVLKSFDLDNITENGYWQRRLDKNYYRNNGRRKSVYSMVDNASPLLGLYTCGLR